MRVKSWKAVPCSILVITLCTMLLTRQTHFFTETDFFAWGKDASLFGDCAKGAGCYLSKFPLGYLFNSALIQAVSTNNLNEAPNILMGLNILYALVFLTAIWSLSICRDLKIHLVFISALLLTPIPSFYIYSGALEFQSGLVLALWALVFSYSRKILTAPLFISTFAACIYKDTNVLLIGAFVLAAVFENRLINHHRSFTRLDKPIASYIFHAKLRISALGLFVGQLAMCGYNYIRYGDIFPRQYLHEAIYRNPNISVKLNNLMSLVLSPQGGLVSFWGLSFVFLLLALDFSYKRFYASALIAVVFTLAGLSGWWAPFGWNAWGSRLTIPIMIMTVALACFATNNGIEMEPLKNLPPAAKGKISRASLIPYKLLVICSITTISFPYVAKSYSPGSTAKKFYDYLYGPTICQHMARKESASTIGDLFWVSDDYYNCSKARFWGE